MRSELLYYPKDLDESHCTNSREGCEFTSTTRNLLFEESKKIFGKTKCMVPDCGAWHALEIHHIRPPWAGGKRNQENGIALCPTHHSWADRGYITPNEIQKYKEGKIEKILTINNQQDVHRFLESSTVPNLDINSPHNAYSYYSIRLRLLSNCLNINLNDCLQKKVLQEIAKTQLDIAGGMTSWLQANLIPKNKSNRYQINILASGALNIAEKIADSYCILHAHHVHAVNANAVGSYDISLEYCKKICDMYPKVGNLNSNYAAYITRNISTIFAKVGFRTKATKLLIESNKYSENDAETWMREAQNQVIWGNFSRAEKLIQQYIFLTKRDFNNLSLNQKTIGYRIKSIFEFLTNNEANAIESLKKAENTAIKAGLGHSIGKLKHAYLYFTSSAFKDFIYKSGLSKLRKGECPIDILHTL